MLALPGAVDARVARTTRRVGSLLVVFGSGALRRVPLGEGVLSIGRDRSCRIRIANQYVAREHAQIRVSGGLAVLVDLGSCQGSLVNGKRVGLPVRLSAGDVIRIGDATLTCVAETATPRTASDSTRLWLDPRAHEVWLGHHRPARRLSVQEFELLRYLYERQHRVCSRDELGDAVWGAHTWDLNMLHQLVHRVKRKIEPNPVRPRYLISVPRFGYRLAA